MSLAPDDDAPEPGRVTFDAATLGPYVVAAATICGQGSAPATVVDTALALAMAAETSGAAAARRLPVRSYEVTGELSITNTNDYRTQIGVDSGHSIHGVDRMWTEAEDPPVARRTRAALERLAGKRVSAVKETVYEYTAAGVVKRDGKGPLTRTRLKHGSLHVVTDDGERIPVDLAAARTPPAIAAVPTPAAASTPPGAPRGEDAAEKRPPYIDAAAGWAWLTNKVGETAAARAWGDHAKTGPMGRTVLAEIRARALEAA